MNAGWDDIEAQALSLDEQCPICHRPPGKECVGQITGERMRASHWQRTKQATQRGTGETP